MNINIYYGGRGIIDDPTLFVINKMQEILEELRVNVIRYNLYECKNTIPTLPQTLKDADGVILAATVEWYGIGGYMQQFLDACWLFGDKSKIAQIYMCPVVMSTTYGEREAKLNLSTAWEILGGLPCSGICGYIENTVMLEMNEQYIKIIEKKAENMYRSINQHIACFPASNQAVKQKVAVPKSTNLTPQETEQLSQYVSDDGYVQRQKQDTEVQSAADGGKAGASHRVHRCGGGRGGAGGRTSGHGGLSVRLRQRDGTVCGQRGHHRPSSAGEAGDSLERHQSQPGQLRHAGVEAAAGGGL